MQPGVEKSDRPVNTQSDMINYRCFCTEIRSTHNHSSSSVTSMHQHPASSL